MTDVDLIKILGYGGWKIDSQEVITSANQVSNATGMLAGCALAAKAKLYQAGDPAMYLPPVGWTVIVAVKESDDGDGEDVEYLWVDPSGVAWLPSKCSNVSVGSQTAAPQIVAASGGGGWLLLLGGAALLWLLVKGK